ncbi:MAG TPA: endoribonuclease MazF [Candidatus Paceibacterota bacterium]|nr:endoribonuclease MazF [Candidatus Paceibacterota bacterium]
MVDKSFVPERGDIIWLNFNPQTGHEQRGRRPALVVSPAIYNEKTGLALVCPITSQKKGYPFEVPLGSSKVKGVVLADQIKSVDWQERRAKLVSRGNEVVFEKIRGLLRELI